MFEPDSIMKGSSSASCERLLEHLSTIPSTVKDLNRESAKSLSGPCPKCGGTDRFYYREDLDRFACRKCHPEKGDTIDLHCWLEDTDFAGLCKTHLPDVYEDRNSAVVNYLLGRKISYKVIQQAIDSGQIWEQQYAGQPAVACLYTDLSGGDQGKRTIQYIPLAGGKKKFKKGALASEDFFITGNRQAKYTVVVEAVINALSVAGAMPDCRVIALGGSTFTRKIEKLKGHEVVCFFDNDDAGRKAVDAAVKILGNCRTVQWSEVDPPGCDPNDLLKAGQGERIREMIGKAETLQQEQPAEQPGAWRLIPIGDIEIRNPDWTVRDYMEIDSVGLIFGDPESGKSFMAVDIACCTATGTDFHGIPVKQGTVVYIAGEGQNGLKRRFMAWGIRHGIDINEAPIFLSSTNASLCDPEFTQAVAEAIEAVKKLAGTPALIVIDTVARNFGPGDENSTKDMSGFIAAADTLRAQSKATVLLVHHSGHGDKTRARGAMALKGALDFEYRMSRADEQVFFECTKMKDAPRPEAMAFELRTVELDQDENGNMVTSAILDPSEYIAQQEPGRSGRGKWQVVALKSLKDLTEEHRARLEGKGFDPDNAKVLAIDWQERCYQAGMPQNRFYKIKRALTDSRVIDAEHDYVTLI